MANDSRKTAFGWAPPQLQDDATEVQQMPPLPPQQQQQPLPAGVDSYEWQQYQAAKSAWEQQQYAWHQQQQQVQQNTYAEQQAYAQQQYAQQQYAQQQAQAQAQLAAYEQQQAYAQQLYVQQQQAAWQQQALQQSQPPQPPQQQQQPRPSRPPSEPPAPPAHASDPATLRSQANATVGVSERVRFIRLTYLHLLFAILAFAGVEYLLNTNPFLVANVSMPLTTFALTGRNWGIVLVAFMAASWVADYWASHTSSRALQYVGLGFYVLAEALIFVPLLAIVAWRTQDILARGGAEPHILRDAAVTTIGVFVALTVSVFVSRKDFSFLRSGLMMASGAALALIFLAIGFGFELGLVFSVAMVLLAAGYMLYQTSQVLAHYDPRSHVAAALALFSSVALMFWYVIRIFLKMRQ
jgi:FtsH-binding integral membrane protein